jgi:hypothetical protein
MKLKQYSFTVYHILHLVQYFKGYHDFSLHNNSGLKKINWNTKNWKERSYLEGSQSGRDIWDFVIQSLMEKQRHIFLNTFEEVNQVRIVISSLKFGKLQQMKCMNHVAHQWRKSWEYRSIHIIIYSSYVRTSQHV